MNMNTLSELLSAMAAGETSSESLIDEALARIALPTGEGARATGYEEEKWHWSYAPLSSWYLRQYPIDVGYERLTGFLGSETAQQIDVIANYVQGINPECMQ